MNRPLYIDWIAEEKGITLKDGIPLETYCLNYTLDDKVLDDWALHIRRHYESDDELAESLAIKKIAVEDYLKEEVIPQKKDALGPAARAGDITEILISDILQFVLGYHSPRYKQANRSGKCNSEHGTDVFAYKFFRTDKKCDSKDELIAAEVKAILSTSDHSVITNAVRHSLKDHDRVSRTLNHMRKKLKSMGHIDESRDIVRFLNPAEDPYKTTFYAVGVSSEDVIVGNVIIDVSGNDLALQANHKLFYVHGKDLMDLTHNIYDRCIK